MVIPLLRQLSLDIILGLTSGAHCSRLQVNNRVPCSYFGPGISIVGVDEETARRPMSDWF